MADYQLLAELLDLPHVQVAGYQILNSERIEVCIESRLEAAVCPNCQRVSAQMHDTAEPQTLRDLAIWGRQCWLRYAPRRFACATCQSTFTERVAWREPALPTRCGTPGISTNARSMRTSPRLRGMRA